MHKSIAMTSGRGPSLGLVAGGVLMMAQAVGAWPHPTHAPTTQAPHTTETVNPALYLLLVIPVGIIVVPVLYSLYQCCTDRSGERRPLMARNQGQNGSVNDGQGGNGNG